MIIAIMQTYYIGINSTAISIVVVANVSELNSMYSANLLLDSNIKAIIYLNTVNIKAILIATGNATLCINIYSYRYRTQEKTLA